MYYNNNNLKGSIINWPNELQMKKEPYKEHEGMLLMQQKHENGVASTDFMFYMDVLN